MSFKDDVNAIISTEDTIQEKNISLIKKDILATAPKIRERILSLAKQHNSQQVFIYNGILFSKIFIECKDKSTHTYGVFCNKDKYKYLYSLNEYAPIFFNGLKRELMNDDINISNWQLVELTYDEDMRDQYSIYSYQYNNNESYVRKWLYLYDKSIHDSYFKVLKELYSFDSTLQVVCEEKTNIMLDRPHIVRTSYYKDYIFDHAINPYACIFIEYINN